MISIFSQQLSNYFVKYRFDNDGCRQDYLVGNSPDFSYIHLLVVRSSTFVSGKFILMGFFLKSSFTENIMIDTQDRLAAKLSNPVMELLRLATMPQSVVNADSIKNHIRQNKIDWDSFSQNAAYHKVLPRVYTTFAKSAVSSVPDVHLKKMEGIFNRSKLKGLSPYRITGQSRQPFVGK